MQKKVRRMNKGLFMVGFLVPSLIFVAVLSISILEIFVSEDIAVIVILADSIYALVFSIVYVYLSWSAIYDESYMNVTPLMYAMPSVLLAFIFRERWRHDFMFLGFRRIFPYYSFITYYDMYVERHDLKVSPIDRSAYRPFQYAFMAFGFFLLFIASVSEHISDEIFLVLVVFYLIVMVKTFLDTVSHTCDAVNALADAVERNCRQNRNMERLKDTARHPSYVVGNDAHRDGNVKRPVKAEKGSRILIIPRGDKKS